MFQKSGTMPPNPFPYPKVDPRRFERVRTDTLQKGDKVVNWAGKTGLVVDVLPPYVMVKADNPAIPEFPIVVMNTAVTPHIRIVERAPKLGLNPAKIAEYDRHRPDYVYKRSLLGSYIKTGLPVYKKIADKVVIGAAPITEIVFGGGE